MTDQQTRELRRSAILAWRDAAAADERAAFHEKEAQRWRQHAETRRQFAAEMDPTVRSGDDPL